VIADECAALDRANILQIDREGKSHDEVTRDVIKGGKPGWVHAWGENKDKWLNWGIVLYDQFPLGDAGMPKTAAMFRNIEGIKVAALSWFKPGTIIPIHSHPEFAAERLLTFHLGLDTPAAHCHLSVGGKFIPGRKRDAFIFDGYEPHYAFNASNEDRIILYCEFYPHRLRHVK